ncbi:MAG: ornithine cyclodeaminase family protein [Pseudomonadota bacterium]
MQLTILNAADVSRALSHADCVKLLHSTMVSVSAGRAVLPLRQTTAIPETKGKLVLMPGYLDPGTGLNDRSFGVKIVSKFPREKNDPNGTHVGMVALFDANVGLPVALMDGGRLTAIRTASASALATDALARKDATTALFIGHGEEAEHHLHALRAVRPVKKLMVWGRSQQRAAAFIDKMQPQAADIEMSVTQDIAEASAAADIICTLTSAADPVFKGEWLTSGTHINMVGAAIPTSAEVDGETVKRSRWYTDYKPSLDAQGGEWINAKAAGIVDDSHLLGEIGAVLAGDAPGRQSDTDITAYKSLGVTAQDLAAAKAAFANAKAQGLGQVVDW